MAKGNLLPASLLAKRILDAAQKSASEEDLKIAIERALEKALTKLGVQSSPEYEKTILSGSADAVYGHVIIEYERPGRLAKVAGFKETIDQLTGYLLGHTIKEGKRQPEALYKMIGVALDGRQIAFVRFTSTERGAEFSLPGLPSGQMSFLEEKGTKGRFQVLGPYPVNEESISVFLLYLRSLSRKPLTPEALSRDFGPSGEIASVLVGSLYAAFQAHKSEPRLSTFYNEWERLFGIVYGEELGKAQTDAKELIEMYKIGHVKSGPHQLKYILFIIHTYFALLMKFLAVELISLQGGMLVTSFASGLPAQTDADLKQLLTDLENGGVFNSMGIVNFLEGDFFRWYLGAWSKDLADSFRQFALTMVQFEPATSTLEPEATRDLLKKLYQYLIPRSLRHDLGEYYTPDWLAERLLNQLGYDGNPDKRIIDPSCGSGTFLILALKRMRQYGMERQMTSKQIAESALKNIVGFDLNPLAVIAARTNYLIALGDLIRSTRPVEIPVYICDSIRIPYSVSGQLSLLDAGSNEYQIPTAAGLFNIPLEVVDNHQVDLLSYVLEESIRNECSQSEFLALARRRLTVSKPSTASVLVSLFEKLVSLHNQKKDGIWARLIKNSFAPLFKGRFDYVAGNPPWINWESLSPEYRNATKQLWIDYGLFTLKGHAARLGGGKKDFSMLFTYVAADRYLKPGGKLGFVITQTVFQTSGAGAGFRRFQIGNREHLGVQFLDDMVDLQPFEGANNWTSVFILKRDIQTKYPVSYTLWKRKSGGRINQDLSLQEVIKTTSRTNLLASPVDAKKTNSSWQAGPAKTNAILSKIKGASSYRAHAGVCTWADGVFWLKVIEKSPDGLLVVENLAESGKRDLPVVRSRIESDLVFPFISWKDIGKFSFVPSHYILMVQDPEKRVGYDESWLKTKYPHTYSYLMNFRELLRKRSGYRKYFSSSDPFYSMYNVSKDNFSPYRVVWKAMGSDIEPVVLSPIRDSLIGTRPPMHKNTVAFVPFDTPEPAHFLCAVLSSSFVNELAKSSSVKGGKSFGNTNLLDNLSIPDYDPSNKLHQTLFALSRRAHEIAKSSENAREIAEIQNKINQSAALLWGITTTEADEIIDTR